METYFVDIGCGTSNLLLLGHGKAIVIDCGKDPSALVGLLYRFKVEHIERLIISHNHNDHVGGALPVMSQYEGKIGQFWFVSDSNLMKSSFARRIKDLIQRKVIDRNQIKRLERIDEPLIIYNDPSQELKLAVFAPEYFDNFTSNQSKNPDPNNTSAVLVLDVAGRRVVFPGDSTVSLWEGIRTMLGGPLECEVLGVPHHAGIVWDAAAQLDWLYTHAVTPKHCIISVPTLNRDNHPREDVIKTILNTGATIQCTQITGKCCASLESLRPGVITPDLPGRSNPKQDVNSNGRSRHVACAGTVAIEIDRSRLVVRRLAEHRAAVDSLQSSGAAKPLCRYS